MAFTLDTSGISIPGIPTPTAPPVSGISDVSKTLVDRLTSSPSSLLANPMVNSVNFLGSSTDSVEKNLRSIATGPAAGTGAITAFHAKTYLAGQGLQDLRSSMGNFMVHTDRLSGLLNSQGVSTPGLQQIMSVGKQMQTMMTLINGASGCTSALGGATGLFSQGAIDAETTKMAAVADRIVKGLATITEVVSTVVGVSQLIKGIVSKDSQFLQQSVNQLQAAASGLVMEALNSDPCMAFLFQTVANKNPGGLMDVLAKPIAK